MSKKNEYRQYLQKMMGGIIDELPISELRKTFLKSRWLDQLLWLESRAKREQNRYYTLRLVAIIGGTLVPAMVGFNGFQGSNNNRIQTAVAYAAFGISQTVAISVAIEEFFAHGKKYLTYRNTAENLKTEGWQYFQLTGPYRQHETHAEAYAQFAQRIEQYIQQDVKGFISNLKEDREDESRSTKARSEQDAQLAIQTLNHTLERNIQQRSTTPYANTHPLSEGGSEERAHHQSPINELSSEESPSSEYLHSEGPSSEYQSTKYQHSEHLYGKQQHSELSQDDLGQTPYTESYLISRPVNKDTYFTFDQNRDV